MTIADLREKCKSLPRDVLVAGVLVLSASSAFGLGYLAGIDAGEGSAAALTPLTAAQESSTEAIVASKFGTKYYRTSCAGAARISEANKVFFATIEAARAAGYEPAANCKGL